MYLTVLANAISSEYTPDEAASAYAQLRLVLGALVMLEASSTVGTLSTLLDISSEDIQETLEDLHAVIDLTEDEDRMVYLHHPSFRDFLTDPTRCTDQRLWTASTEGHKVLAHGCLRIMSISLKPDICGLDLPGKPRRSGRWLGKISMTSLSTFPPRSNIPVSFGSTTSLKVVKMLWMRELLLNF